MSIIVIFQGNNMVTELEGILELIYSHSSFFCFFRWKLKTEKRKETLWSVPYTTVKYFSS